VTNIYVGNLPYTASEDDLAQHFSQWGQVERVTLVFDRETGRPRGFGFVEMIDDDDAQKAIELAHGEPFNGRPLTVNQARPRAYTPNAAAHPAPASAGYDPAPPSSGDGYHNPASASPTSTPTPTPVTTSTPALEDAETPQDTLAPVGSGYSNTFYS